MEKECQVFNNGEYLTIHCECQSATSSEPEVIEEVWAVYRGAANITNKFSNPTLMFSERALEAIIAQEKAEAEEYGGIQHESKAWLAAEYAAGMSN